MNYNLTDLQHWFMLNLVSYKIIYIIGLLVVFSFIIHTITKRFRVPSVVGYILTGTLFSVSVIRHLPFFSAEFIEWYSYLIDSFNYVTILAVSFIAFTIGTSLSIKILKRLELEFALIVLLESFGAFFLVTISMLLLGKTLYIALILGAIATATAPAATVMVLKEYGSEGELSATLMVVLALDEALALIIFGFIEPLSLLGLTPGAELSIINLLLIPLGKIIGAIFIGLVAGYFSQRLMGSYHTKSRKVLLILATVFGVSALAISLGLSHLIANLSVGFAYRNFAKKHLEIADRIDTLTIPLFAIYFILAGTKIDIYKITSGGFLLIALIYTLARITGKVGGASIGAKLSRAPDKVQKFLGFGLLPQIGVAIDLAYIVQHNFIRLSSEASEISLLIFNIILFTTVITEIIGPLLTEYALIRSGEIRSGEGNE
ncbi:MAG: hypothetical protein PWR10_1154 [Halanaerobiales bacterium]|nr:hypothetical protein [Halanaerobiales bacterium]